MNGHLSNVTATAKVPMRLVKFWQQQMQVMLMLLIAQPLVRVLTIVDGQLYSSAERTLHATFTPLQNNLAEAGDVKVVINFRKAA